MITDLSFAPPADLSGRFRNALTVWVSEDWGYRRWLWFPECLASELERRWRATQHFSWEPPPAFLWGDWVDVDEGANADALRAIYERATAEFGPSRPALYGAFIDGDEPHSRLVAPDGRQIFHAGVEGLAVERPRPGKALG